MADNQGRVEIKFLTDIKELENAKKAIQDLSKNIDKALDSTKGDGATKAFTNMSSEAKTTSESVDEVTESVEKLETEASQLSKGNNGFENMAKEADSTAKKVDEVTTSVDELSAETSQLTKGNSGMDAMGDEATVTAKKVDETTQSVDKLGVEVDDLGKTDGLGNIPDDIEDIGDKSNKSMGGVKNLVGALGLLKVAGVALNMITDSVADAVGRVDTMRQFPKMMQQVGFSADETDKSIDRLSKGIQGLPTRLDDVVATAQQIALTTGDLNEATELTLALNNAFLASGSSGADASRGLQQFSQMLATGKVDMQSWRTLLETMPLALQTVAENFGFTGNAAKNDLFAALQDGTITFDEFSQSLIDANNAQGGFAELALTNSEGMATSWANIRTSVVNGVAKVIEALDELSEELTGKGIAENFDSIKVVVGDAFTAISGAIRGSTPYIRSAIDLMQRLAPVIIGVASAYASYKIITSVIGWFKTYNDVVKVLSTTKAVHLGITKSLTLAEVTATTAQKALAIVTGLYTGNVAVATVATKIFSGALAFLTGPIGLAVAAVGLLAGGLALLYGWLGDTSPEVAEMASELDDASSKTNDLTGKVEANKEAFENSLTSIESNKNALKDMADELSDLVAKEEKSATDKQMIKNYTDELNSSIEGLNLTYDEEANKLSLSADAIYDKIDALADLAKAEVAQERQIEIIRELAEADIQLATNTRLLAEAQEELDSAGGNWFGRNTDLINSTKELEDEQIALQGTIGGLKSEYETVTGVIEATSEAQAKAVEDGTGRQIIAFEDLEQAQQDTITNLQDYYSGLKDHTQEMFDEINDTIMTTTDAGDEVAKTSAQIFSEMQTTLEHNQEVVATWADNMSTLAQRGIDEGLLEELSRLGPEGAPYVQALVDASDEELASLSETFASGGAEALDALQESLGLEDFELEGLEGIITKAETSLSEQIKDSGLSKLGGTIVEKIGEGMASAEGLTESVNQVIDPLPEAVASKSTEMQTAGGDLIAGAVAGVDENKGNLSTSTETAATEALDAFKSASGVASPSTLYAQAAADIVLGAIQGISENKESLNAATRSMATGAISAFREGSSGAVSAGIQLAEGFRSGLASRRNSIINTATSIANAATAAINKALDVRSPSRKGFYSGEMLGKGVGLGIQGQYGFVKDSADALGIKAIPDMTPIDIQSALNVPHFRTNQGNFNSQSNKNIIDLSKTNELLERISLKDPSLVAEDGAILARYRGPMDRENAVIARNKLGRRLRGNGIN